MPDIYATITDADEATLERLADAMERRAAQPEQHAMLQSYLSEVRFPPDARVLEVGCGTGAISRVIARWPNVGQAVGLDPSPFLVKRARQLSPDQMNLTFDEADGRNLPVPDASFDVVVIHTVLSHVPGPELVIAEALRALRPGGTLAVFDGDYATATVANGQYDPLQSCVDAAFSSLANDSWVVRRMSAIATEAGFEVRSFRSHGYIDSDGGYMLTLVDRGADFLAAWGRISPALARALKDEARHRLDAGHFFGHIAYASMIATKPA